jgi:hypothetical protein
MVSGPALIRTHAAISPNKNFKFNKRPAIPYHSFSVPGGSEVSLCLNGQIFDPPSASPRLSPNLFEPRPRATLFFSIASTLLKITHPQQTYFQQLPHSLQNNPGVHPLKANLRRNLCSNFAAPTLGCRTLRGQRVRVLNFCPQGDVPPTPAPPSCPLIATSLLRCILTSPSPTMLPLSPRAMPTNSQIPCCAKLT